MYGSSLNTAIFGLGLPEYFVFGTKVRLPAVVNWVSFHGPSTTDQIGLFG